MSEQELLFTGAVIALISSLLTTIVAGLLSHWLKERSRRKEKEEELYRLLGELAHFEDGEQWQNTLTEGEKRLHEEGLSKSDFRLNATIGALKNRITEIEREIGNKELPVENTEDKSEER